ncbi:hypothetical protein BOH72_19425 [Mycobacterium sp. WY10]|nr:hypothetical protein BOH72_19425 [Mycobacterium sp. WY10]
MTTTGNQVPLFARDQAVTIASNRDGDLRMWAEVATTGGLLRAGARAMQVAEAMLDRDIDTLDPPSGFKVEITVTTIVNP